VNANGGAYEFITIAERPFTKGAMMPPQPSSVAPLSPKRRGEVISGTQKYNPDVDFQHAIESLKDHDSPQVREEMAAAGLVANRMSATENILYVWPIGCQLLRIF
jgi:hypothetical protein